jgi:archaellum biogenesis protein FlaJ (TadC family)
MQDTELFLSLAEIAGVFVGFGALIAVRSGGPRDVVEVTAIQWVLVNAVWVVVVALVPVTLSGYGLAGHELWLVCSLVAVASFLGMLIVWRRTPEAAESIVAGSRSENLRSTVINALTLVPMTAALVLVVLGLFPEQEQALYLTAVVLGLFLTALTLLTLVFMPRRPQPASGPAEPATGGSTA